MFGALNRFISRLDSDASSEKRDSYSASGFQILRNKNADIPIEPWYDFVIGINGRSIVLKPMLNIVLMTTYTHIDQDNSDPTLFATEIRNCAGSAVRLTLWNAKGQHVRTIDLAVPTPSPTLGLTLQWTSLSLAEDVWHILDVMPNSPADIAGLLPYGDYIVGTPEGLVHGEAGLGELVEDHLSRPLRLYVYNHEYAVTRLVTITPSRNWGGNGALGCILGFGALHRLPQPLTEPPAAPGETLYETAHLSHEEQQASFMQPRTSSSQDILSEQPSAQQSSEFIVPATMKSPPPSTPFTVTTSVGPPRFSKKTRHAISPTNAFDEYFKEGEQKSKEEDFAARTKAVVPPPPPKAQAGPRKDRNLQIEDE